MGPPKCVESSGLNFCDICFNCSSKEAEGLIGLTGYFVDMVRLEQIQVPMGGYVLL